LLQLDPYSLAYVSFTPSASNPHPEFADEVYFPPQTEEEVEQDLMMGPGSADGKVMLSSCVLEYRTEFISEHSASHVTDHPERSVSSAVKSGC
jgi:hypothetical protein